MTARAQGASLPVRMTLPRRVQNWLRTLFARGDFSTLIITCGILVIPVLALNTSLGISQEFARQSASWPVGLNDLIPIAIVSVVIGFLLARSYLSELVSLVLTGVFCVGTIMIIQLLAAPGDLVTRCIELIRRFTQTLQNSLHSNTLDPFILVLFLSILIWFLGHNTAWHTFRLDRVWRAILPPGIVLVLNAFYTTDQSQVNLDLYLIVYVFLSLLLIIRSHIEAREFDWYANRVSVQGNLNTVRAWLFRSGAILALILIALAWLLPTGNAADNAQRFKDFLSADTINKIQELLNKLFSNLESKGAPSADYYGGDTLQLGGAIRLGDQIVMVVKAPTGPRYYWKSRVFDRYESNSWTSPRSYEITADGPGLELKYPPVDPSLRQSVDQKFSMEIGSSRLVYAAPQPVTFGLPVVVDVDYVDQAAKTVNPSVTRPVNPLQNGDTYQVTSSISIASAPALRALPATYPEWVKALDLQLPATISQRTRALALQIVQQTNAQTAYDKAKAIEQWLRAHITYNETIENPPANRDLVDWVLFDYKQGYCTYYASAMIVMLRTLGIPARMGAGFAQGVYDGAAQTYVVRERDAHTWVEVYFQQAGWVEFEPTSAQQTLDRVDPNATARPAAIPTNTPTPTPPPTLTPAPAQNNAQPPAAITQTPSPAPQSQGGTTTPLAPSATPSAMPSATATLVPVISLPPTVSNGLNILLVLAIIIAIVSFLAVGLLWWIEYRGLDRISPIGRAYARLGIYARWLRIPLAQTNTPLERGRRIAKDVPTGSNAVNTITDMYINERYARPHNATPNQEDEADDAWRRARRAFITRRLKRFFRRE
ncbi:MAG TPA: transglutaminase domain-containing protein [Aggregatilineales bacterium]|nr:transglutaminase domain-containing protein [Aggregatilineales bacterium]